MRRMIIYAGVLCMLLVPNTIPLSAHAAADPAQALETDPKVVLIEHALLQQLRPVIMESLGKIFEESYSQFDCEQILSINERETVRRGRGETWEADAVHGAQYFEIQIRVCRPNGDQVELAIKNDSLNAKYYMTEYKIIPAVELENQPNRNAP